MKNLSPLAYKNLFKKHVWRFLTNVTTLRELSGNHAVAVSGGLDSMTLLWLAHHFHLEGLIGPVRAIIVNHGTREGQKTEVAMVKKFCHEEGIPFSELKAEGLSAFMGNFEASARQKRRALCLNSLLGKELLWVGHHLDDSHEWSFMQRQRSTNPKSCIGIPVRNRKIVRPFLCVTRSHIKKISQFEGIPYMNDPSNRDLRFDRNYIRHQIVPQIKARYPKYLKFYAHNANHMAMFLNVSILSRSGLSKLFLYEEGAVLIGKHFTQFKIQELIHMFSNADRGEIITPIERMLKAIDNNKKGPFHFSGGVEAYFSSGLLMIYKNGLKNYDHEIAETLSKVTKNSLMMVAPFSRAELEKAWQNTLQSPSGMKIMPGLALVLESDSICKTLNTTIYDVKFPEVSRQCKEMGIRFISMQKCLDVWMLKRQRLPEKLRIVPLYGLSNLFTFQ